MKAFSKLTNTMLTAGEALALKESWFSGVVSEVGQALGENEKTFAGEVLNAVENERTTFWQQRVAKINWELFDRGIETYTWYAMEELSKGAIDKVLLQAPQPRDKAIRAGNNQSGRWSVASGQ